MQNDLDNFLESSDIITVPIKGHPIQFTLEEVRALRNALMRDPVISSDLDSLWATDKNSIAALEGTIM